MLLASAIYKYYSRCETLREKLSIRWPNGAPKELSKPEYGHVARSGDAASPALPITRTPRLHHRHLRKALKLALYAVNAAEMVFFAVGGSQGRPSSTMQIKIAGSTLFANDHMRSVLRSTSLCSFYSATKPQYFQDPNENIVIN